MIERVLISSLDPDIYHMKEMTEQARQYEQTVSGNIMSLSFLQHKYKITDIYQTENNN